MGWLDNIIGWISPEWGARREVWRQYMNEVRHYDAGDYSRLNSGWYASNQSRGYRPIQPGHRPGKSKRPRTKL